MTFASGTIYYVPVTITNSQTTATPSTFQTMVTVNSSNYTTYLASNLSNVNWQDGAGNILNSWLESGNSNTSTSSTYWIKLTNAIPANSSTTIYLCFYSTTTNNFNTTTTGEAPTLSGTYGQYDNGATVFSNYWNFAGTSLPSGLTSVGTVSVSNGLSINSGSTLNAIYSNSTFSYPIIGEMYGIFAAQTADGGGTIDNQFGLGQDSSYVLSAISNNGAVAISNYHYNTNKLILQSNSAGVATNAITTTAFSTSNAIYGIAYTGSTNALYLNYTSIGTLSGSPTVALPLVVLTGGSSTGNFSISWLRTRAYPPNATMPSDSFGEVGAVSGTGPSLLMSLTTQ